MRGDGPLALWPMQDGHGAAVAKDVSGNGRDLTLIGAPTMTAPGPSPGLRAIGFNGINQAASRALDLSTFQAVTLTALVWWDTFANDDDLLAEFTPNYGGVTGGFIIDPNSSSPTSGTWQAALRGDVAGFSSAETTRPDARRWQQWTTVFDKSAPGGSEVLLYRDGRALSFATAGGAVNNTNTFANSTLFLMSRAGTSLFGAGRLAYTGVYPVALSPAQIADHWTAFVRGRE